MRLSSVVGFLLIVVGLLVKMAVLLVLGVLVLLIPLVLGAVRLFGRNRAEPSNRGEPSAAGLEAIYGGGRGWWPKADVMLKQQIVWLQEGRIASTQLQGFPFDAAYVRRAQRIAGRGYKVILTTSDMVPTHPAILVVPRN